MDLLLFFNDDFIVNLRMVGTIVRNCVFFFFFDSSKKWCLAIDLYPSFRFFDF